MIQSIDPSSFVIQALLIVSECSIQHAMWRTMYPLLWLRRIWLEYERGEVSF